MITWAEIILLLLRITNAIVSAIDRQKWMKAGADAEIAKISASILAKTTYGKEIFAKVNAYDEATVDSELRKLEPR